MTFVRLNSKPSTRSFNNLMDDLFTAVPSIFRDDFGTNFKSGVPVNIKETESAYELDLVAPGLEKEDFRINLDNNTLTISVEKKKEEQKENEKQIRTEYRFQSFSRSFTVDDTVNAENIAAKYVNGVLTLNLPKKAEVKAAAKQINIQ